MVAAILVTYGLIGESEYQSLRAMSESRVEIINAQERAFFGYVARD